MGTREFERVPLQLLIRRHSQNTVNPTAQESSTWPSRLLTRNANVAVRQSYEQVSTSNVPISERVPVFNIEQQACLTTRVLPTRLSRAAEFCQRHLG